MITISIIRPHIRIGWCIPSNMNNGIIQSTQQLFCISRYSQFHVFYPACPQNCKQCSDTGTGTICIYNQCASGYIFKSADGTCNGEILASLKVVPYEASLRLEFRVSTGMKSEKIDVNPRHYVILHAFYALIEPFMPVETRNSCLSEAASDTTFMLWFCDLFSNILSERHFLLVNNWN